MYNPLVSIVILNYNGKRHLEKCLPSVLETKYLNIEIIIVDNGSVDGSLEFLNNFSSDSRIRVIKNMLNMGYAGGNNKGIEIARGEYLVFLNNDTLVEPEWLFELVSVMESDVSIGAAQSKLLLMDSPKKLDCVGNFSYFDGSTIPRGLLETDVGQYAFGEIFSCKGASMIVRREVLDRVGTFDSDYFAYYEETDLCWRIRLAGFKIVFVPSSVVYHKGEGSIPRYGREASFFQVYLMKRNRILTLLKNYEIRNIIRYLLPSIVYEYARIITEESSSKTSIYLIEISKAVLWNLKHFRRTWKKRTFVQNVVRSKSDQEIKHMMLLRKL